MSTVPRVGDLEPPVLTFVTRLVVDAGPGVGLGETPAGRRSVAPINGGTMDGPLLRGTVTGPGADWSVIRPDGACVVSAHYLVRTHDGVVLDVVNEGLVHLGEAPMGLTTPRFEAPEGPYAWLNHHVFVGTLWPSEGSTVTLDFFRVERVPEIEGAQP